MKQIILAILFGSRRWMIAVFALGVLAFVGWSLPTVFWPVVALSAIIGAIAGSVATIMGLIGLVFYGFRRHTSGT